MPSPFDLPAGSGHVEEKTTPARVSPFKVPLSVVRTTHSSARFMSDKIMPMSEAVEGYVCLVIFPQRSFLVTLKRRYEVLRGGSLMSLPELGLIRTQDLFDKMKVQKGT